MFKNQTKRNLTFYSCGSEVLEFLLSLRVVAVGLKGYLNLPINVTQSLLV